MNTLGDICKFNYGKALPKRSRVDGPVAVYGSNGVVGRHDRAITDGPTIIIGRKGSIGEINYSEVGCYPIDTTYYIDRTCTQVDLEWLSYALSALGLKKLNKAAAIPGLNRNDAYNIKLRVPRPSEQQRIVARIKECLGKVDEVEALRSKQHDEITELQTAAFHEISRSDNWPSKKIGEVITESRNGRSLNANAIEGNGHVLTLAAVHDLQLDQSQKKPVVMDDKIAKQFSYKEDDVFVSRANTFDLVGLSSYADKNSDKRTIYPDLLIRLRADTNQILPRYLAFALRLPDSRSQIRQNAKGANRSMVKISGANLREFTIPIPPISEQHKILERLDAFIPTYDDLKALAHENDAAALHESILHQAFAGEL